ncbi:hypothetical protein KKB3_01399, partial [Dehalococcoides mccartyi]
GVCGGQIRLCYMAENIHSALSCLAGRQAECQQGVYQRHFRLKAVVGNNPFLMLFPVGDDCIPIQLQSRWQQL